MKIHRKKLLPKYFKEVENGNKTFEVREDDCNYNVEDILILQEYVLYDFPYLSGRTDDIKGYYTGKELKKEISYKLSYRDFPQGLKEGYCVLSIKDIESGEE